MTLAEMLANRIRETGESQAAFARRLEVSPQTLGQILKGDIKVPTAAVRRRLATELRISHVDLLAVLGEITPEEAGTSPPIFPPGTLEAQAIDLIRRLTPDRLILAVGMLEVFAGVRPAADVSRWYPPPVDSA